MEPLTIIKESGRKGVKIIKDNREHPMELAIMRNGNQWVVNFIDEEILEMLAEASQEAIQKLSK